MKLFKLTDAGPIELTNADDVLVPGDRFLLVQETADDPHAIQAVLRALVAPRPVSIAVEER